MNKRLEIGDYNRTRRYQITDTSGDINGTLRVTVRELIGERQLPKDRIDAMRRVARRALPECHSGQIRGTRTVRTWYADGCYHATFDVYRKDPR